MAGDRGRIVVLYTATGAALGVLITVLFFSSATGRTDIRVGGTLLVLGLALGFAAGVPLHDLATARPRTEGTIVTGGVLMLAIGAGTAVGWAVGDLYTRQEPNREFNHQRGMTLGVGIGVALGLIALIPRWLRRPGNVPAEPPTPDRPS
jgi:hypothetical protein